MTSANPEHFNDADFQAYADGQLAAHRVPEFEAELARAPELALRIAEIREQNAALRDALDPVLAEPIPERLVAAAVPPPRRGGALRRMIVSSLAAAAVLVVGISVGWIARDALLERAGTPTTFARQAALTHALYAADVRRPVEVWASEEKGLVTWLTKRLGFPVYAPNLNDVGFALVGGRLVAGNEKPTALFMYENADHQRLSLQVRKQSSALRHGVGRERRDRIPLLLRQWRRRFLLDRRRLRLRDLGQRRSRPAAQDRPGRLRPARGAGGLGSEVTARSARAGAR